MILKSLINSMLFFRDMEHINENRWESMIKSIENDFNSLETNKKRVIRALKDKIIESVKKNASDNCGVLFSGGIDSTLIAFILKKLNIKFTCYSVGLKNSQDLEWAGKIAKELGFKLKTRILNLEELDVIFKTVTNILNEPDVMKVGVGSVIYVGCEMAKDAGIRTIFSGLGSEEIFAGYERHAKDNFEDIHRECWNGLKEMWQRDIKRDLLISKANDIEIKLPFLDIEVIKTAMNIHPMFKIDKENKKIILREAAEEIGLKKEFVWRKKKAAQYGSNFIKGMDKLAKKNGFEKKKDYLRSLL